MDVTLEPDEQTAVAALGQWLDEADRPYALLHGARASRRAIVAAHLVRAQQQTGPYAAHLVPIGPDLRLERDILALLTARLVEDYAGGSPRHLRRQIAEDHLRVGPPEGQPPLLLTVTDVEEAETPMPWAALFAGAGPRVKVLVTAEGDTSTTGVWLERFGFEPERTLQYALSAGTWPGSHDLAASGAAHSGLFQLLATAFGRLRAEEITTALQTTIEGALAGGEPSIAAFEGTYAFRWNAFRREIGERLDRDSRDTWTRRLLSLPPNGYPCAYTRAHLEQSSAPIAAFTSLVTESHLAQWMTRPDAYLGMIADLERVRHRAVQELSTGRDVSSLALAVRAALVEASVIACADRDDSSAPVGVLHIDRQMRFADARQQVRLLTELGAAMGPGLDRAEVLAHAENAAQHLTKPEARGDALVALAELAEGDDRSELAHRAGCAYRCLAEPALPLLVAVKVLPPGEGLAVVREAIAMLQEAGADPGDIAFFAGSFPRAVAEALWADAAALPLPARARILAALAENLRDPDRVRAAFAVLEEHADPYDPLALSDLERLLPLLDGPEARRAARLAPRFGDRGPALIEALVPRLRAAGDPANDLLDALSPVARIRALARSLPVAADPAPLRASIDKALHETDALTRYGLLFDVGPLLAAAGEGDALLSSIEPLGDAHLLSAVAFLARHDPTRAAERALRAFAISSRISPDEAYRLLDLVPLASYLPAQNAASMLGILLDAVADESRPAALSGDGTSLRRLVPLLAALGGDAGLAETAREVVRVCAWFP